MSDAELFPATLITGASSGIGREIARVAARDSGHLVLIGRSKDALESLAAEIGQQGTPCSIISVDLAEPASPRAIEAELNRLGLYCDVLVNSAGYGLFGLASELDPTEQLGILDVNARALTELSLLFLPGMLTRGRGGILNVGSMTALAPGPRMAVYYATKAFVQSFSRSLALEVLGSGVTVTCLTSGSARTAFYDRCAMGSTRISKLYPRMNADEVARAGWKAFRQGRAQVIPGAASRGIAIIARHAPRPLVDYVMRTLQRPL